MSKVKIQGNASGTGVLTVEAPNTNTDRTITLPDGDVTMGVGIDDNATSTAVTLDSSGNVGIGTSSPSQLLSVTGNAMLQANQGYMYLSNVGTGNSGIYVRGTGTANELRSHSTGVHTWEVNGSEKMRIDSSGNILFNTSSVSDGSDNSMTYKVTGDETLILSSAGTGGSYMIRFMNANGAVGQIISSGSSTSYGTTSDYRLKENVVPMTGSIDRLKELKPSKFNFIADADKTVDGFLAHEAGEVVPECATGEKDAMRTEEYEVTPALGNAVTYLDTGEIGQVHNEGIEEGKQADGHAWVKTTEAVMGEREVPDYQGIDQSKLVPLLVASLQEAVAKIEALETRVTQLENA